jgi:ankyrin repeat protein
MDEPELDEEDVEAVVQAAEAGDLAEVRRLVQQDRRLLDTASDGYIPLTAAVVGGHVGMVRCLLEEGAQVNLLDPMGNTALDWACDRGSLQVVTLLLAHGADAAAPHDDGYAPLMFACTRGHADVVARLVAHGCGDLDGQDSDGRTAMHIACYRGHAGVVRALLGAGADPHVVDGYDETPMAMAVRTGRAECVAVLQVRLCLMYGLSHHSETYALLVLGRTGVCSEALRCLDMTSSFFTHAGVGVPLPPLQGPPPPRCRPHTTPPGQQQLNRHEQQPGAGVRGL